MTSPSAPLRIGQYVVERVIGSGAMGEVVAARHAGRGHRVAIKFVKPEMMERERARERFLLEVRALTLLVHPNIVRALDFGTLEDGSPYLVMDLLAGGTLRDEVRSRGALPVAEAVDYTLQACIGLAAAHAEGIVHRDIKPSNLFLAREERGATVKILDFGISKMPKETDHELSLTDTSTLLGSPSYMSPEQVRLSKKVDARADIWGIGVVLYQLLTGRLPFAGDGFSALCAAVTADPPAPLRTEGSEIPQGLEAVVLRCLQKNPDWRYGSAADLAMALAPFAPEHARGLVASLSVMGSRTIPDAFELTSSELGGDGPSSTEMTATASLPNPYGSTTSSARRRWPVGIGVAAIAIVVIAIGSLASRAARHASSSPTVAAPAPQAALATTEGAAAAQPPGPLIAPLEPPSSTPSAAKQRPRLASPRPPKPASSSPRPSGKPAAFGGSALDDHN